VGRRNISKGILTKKEKRERERRRETGERVSHTSSPLQVMFILEHLYSASREVVVGGECQEGDGIGRGLGEVEKVALIYLATEEGVVER
jgi:hypothetical protein